MTSCWSAVPDTESQKRDRGNGKVLYNGRVRLRCCGPVCVAGSVASYCYPAVWKTRLGRARGTAPNAPACSAGRGALFGQQSLLQGASRPALMMDPYQRPVRRFARTPRTASAAKAKARNIAAAVRRLEGLPGE